jgi:hypothetical protein
MKAPKKITEITEANASAKIANPKVLSKIKRSNNINFSVDKNVNFDESEIRITVKGNNIVARFFLKGIPVKEQVVLVKPIPTPPPIKPRDIIKALEAIRLNFNLDK